MDSLLEEHGKWLRQSGMQKKPSSSGDGLEA
jgi:hypothetical protein